MPYADPEKARAARRESARRRRAAHPQAARDYDRDQKQHRRAQQRAGPNAGARELELRQRYPERAVRSVRMGLGRRHDLPVAIEDGGYGEPRADPDREWRPGYDDWMPRAGYGRFAAPFDYDEEEQAWLTYYREFLTPPMLRCLRLSPGQARWMIEDGEGPDDPDRGAGKPHHTVRSGGGSPDRGREQRRRPEVGGQDVGELGGSVPAGEKPAARHHRRSVGWVESLGTHSKGRSTGFATTGAAAHLGIGADWRGFEALAGPVVVASDERVLSESVAR